MSDMRKAVRVELNEQGPYDAYVQEETWNGFAVPAFPKHTAERVLNDSKGWSWFFDDSIDAFVIRNEGDDLGDLPYICQGFAANTEHGLLWLYPIGAFFWVWTIAEDRHYASKKRA